MNNPENTANSPLSSQTSGHRPSVIQLAIKEKSALHASYVALFQDGGIFVPSTREYDLGDDIYVLLTLPDDPQRYPVAGKVGWITPPKASGGRTQGVGIIFPANDEKVRALKARIEQILGSHIATEKPTQTV